MRKTLMMAALVASPLRAAEPVFRDDFRDGLAPGWTWVREDPKAWRTTPKGLELRLLPGNMWGPPNNAKNVLVRPAPDPGPGGVVISMKVENEPSEQYEQVDLVWYYDDSNMVKLGLEQVDGKLCVVMGREENDRTRTLALIPKGKPSLSLRLTVGDGKITGHYRLEGAEEWEKAGECALPDLKEPKVSVQAYQGPEKVERWARISEFRIERIGGRSPGPEQSPGSKAN